MSQPPPWPPQQPDGRPPAQPPAQPYAPPPAQPPAQPYEPAQAGSGNPYGGQPVADNPYATQQHAQPQPPAQPPQPPPYGAYPPPPQGPGTPLPQGPGKRRTPLIVGAALVALVLIGGGVWFALGTGGEDDPKGPVAEGSASASPSVSAAPSGSEETPPEESPSPSVAPTPTGTGLQAVWRTSGSTMLGLGEEYLDEPARINAVLTTADGLDCEGRWQKDESGDFLEMALLCKEDGVRVKSKDRIGNLEQTGDTLSVEWKKGATGTETFERARDLEPE
ncbi:hypothetical protein ACFVDT_16665 [Streptomyces sp. NPDC057699]|uniref:hypothetical protein n=1 Tax=Streptomyces sp. NPDC057699 TaxID=3346220 RepID=UPI0036B6B4BD